MNNDDLLCSALDNSLMQQGDNSVKNSISYQVNDGFSEAYSTLSDKDHEGVLDKGDEASGQTLTKNNAMTMSYGEITLDQELQNCKENSEYPMKDSLLGDSSKSLVLERNKHVDTNKDCISSDFQDKSSSLANLPEPAPSLELEVNIHDDLERDDIEEDVMSGSYGEISLDRELPSSNKNSDSQSSKEDLKMFPSDECKSEIANEDQVKEKRRPDSLVLTQNVLAAHSEEFMSSAKDSSYVQQMHKSQQTSECRTSAEVSPSLSSEEYALHSMGHARSGSDTSGLSELQGTLTVDGDLVTFVAEDLQEKIKMSSPVSRVTDSSSFPGSRSSTPSLYRQALQPQYHIVDPHVISDLEAQAKKVASVVDNMLENLSETLQSFSSLTVACMETYESSVCKTCDAVDTNIKSVYQLMAKCEELSNSMQPLYKISGEVKHIKKMLDQLEHFAEHKS